MPQLLVKDVCVIGAGSAGLAVAKGARGLGASVALVERGLMGGDCLNYGCVPSKALLAAGRVAEMARRAADFGIELSEPRADGRGVHRHVHEVMAAIEPHDSARRYEGLGVRVIPETARFLGPDELEAGPWRIRARRFVIATGCRGAVPSIDGLADVPFLTNESLFGLEVVPEHLIVIGGGAIGVEMSQAFRALGSRVTLLEASASILARDDPELVDLVRAQLVRQGVSVLEGATVEWVKGADDSVIVQVRQGGQSYRLEGSHLLVAAGRRPVLDDLALDRAGVVVGDRGIVVDERLRTSNPRIYAAGDVTGHLPFAHVAGYHGRVVVRNGLLGIPTRVDYRAMPWVTFSEPELAQCGLTEAQARERFGDIEVGRWEFGNIDRAQLERETKGLIKVVARRDGRVVGAGIVGHGAGEAIQSWVLSVALGIRLRDLARTVMPYPTIGYANRSLAETMARATRWERLVAWFHRRVGPAWSEA